MPADRLAHRIRSERKRLGLTMEDLAAKVGISPVTLQRIETGKSSPSVALLSEIAQNLNQSIVAFVEDVEKPTVFIKEKEQQIVSTPALKVKVIGPKNMVSPTIVITYVEMEKGKRTDAHSNPGVEFAYVIEGKSEYRRNGQIIIMEAGDSLSYDGRAEHSVAALEDLKFFGVYVKESKP
jgi:transcriptional regulator with XRE-family HTH domain